MSRNAAADPVPSDSDTEISVVGDAPFAAGPDYVSITAKLEVTAASATEALTQLDARSTKVLDALKAVCPGLQSRNRGDKFGAQAASSLRPGAAITVSRVLAIDCPAVDKAGKLVDGTLGISGTEIIDVAFSVRDNNKPNLDAVQTASKRAQEKAGLVATALGVKLGPVISSVVTEEPEGEALREQLHAGQAAQDYGDRVQHVYVTMRYRIAK